MVFWNVPLSVAVARRRQDDTALNSIFDYSDGAGAQSLWTQSITPPPPPPPLIKK